MNMRVSLRVSAKTDIAPEFCGKISDVAELGRHVCRGTEVECHIHTRCVHVSLQRENQGR